MSGETFINRIVAGDARAVARAISKVEDGARDAAELMKAVFPRTGRATVIGITGAPGAGKSTLVDKLALSYRKLNERIGIVAVDPSSPFSGGAILGDRIRMQTLGLDKDVFIRSMAARGNLGGLARATVDAVAILDAAGYNKVIIETVGVGQDEVDIVKTADVTVVVLVPGMGDDIQAIKAGIMEIGDVFAINKADRDGVLRTERELEQLLSLVEEHGDWIPPLVKTVASTNQGTGDLDAAIAKHFNHLQTSGELDRRNRERVRIRIETMLKEKFMDRLIGKTISRDDYEQLLDDVLHKKGNPHDAAEGLLARVSFGR